jgi:hypothetical protein
MDELKKTTNNFSQESWCPALTEIRSIAAWAELDRAITQAVSGWLLPAAARVRARIWSSGICGEKVALGQVLSEYFGFPCQIRIPPIAPQSPSSIVWGWYNRPVVAAVPSGLSLTPLRIKKKEPCYMFLVEW